MLDFCPLPNGISERVIHPGEIRPEFLKKSLSPHLDNFIACPDRYPVLSVHFRIPCRRERCGKTEPGQERVWGTQENAQNIIPGAVRKWLSAYNIFMLTSAKFRQNTLACDGICHIGSAHLTAREYIWVVGCHDKLLCRNAILRQSLDDSRYHAGNQVLRNNEIRQIICFRQFLTG